MDNFEKIKKYIDRLKHALFVRSDAELAEKFGYSKQTIANWRSRGNLPHKAEVKILNMLGGEYAYSDIYKTFYINDLEVLNIIGMGVFWKVFWNIVEKKGYQNEQQIIKDIYWGFYDFKELNKFLIKLTATQNNFFNDSGLSLVLIEEYFTNTDDGKKIIDDIINTLNKHIVTENNHTTFKDRLVTFPKIGKKVDQNENSNDEKRTY